MQFAKCLGLLLSVVALMLSIGPARAQSSFSAPGAGTSSAMEGPGPSAAVSGRPSTLVLTPPLVAKLGTLADGLHKEIVLCLVGIITGEVGRATDFVMPTPHESAPRAGSFDACPGESLAVWHNHPLPELVEGLGDSARPQVRARPRAPAEARELCRLSGSDIGTLAAQGRPFAVVSVDRNTWCCRIQECRHGVTTQSFEMTATLFQNVDQIETGECVVETDLARAVRTGF